MKITMYELLGMVKDGKAPKKIKFDTNKYIWYEEQEEYRRYHYDNNLYYSTWLDYDLTKCLNDEVEILDDEEKKIPEKLKIEQDTPSSNYYIRNENGTKCALTKHSKMIAETLNQLIDYLEKQRKGE